MAVGGPTLACRWPIVLRRGLRTPPPSRYFWRSCASRAARTPAGGTTTLDRETTKLHPGHKEEILCSRLEHDGAGEQEVGKLVAGVASAEERGHLYHLAVVLLGRVDPRDERSEHSLYLY